MPPESEDEKIYMALPMDGYADAIERVAFTSAPLLAGFAITFIGFILASKVSMQWPNATLAALTAAAMLLIFSIQMAFTGRRLYLPYTEFKQRLELLDESGAAALSAERSRYIESLNDNRRLMRMAGRLYNLGIAALLIGIAAALVPAGLLGTLDGGRLVAIAIASVAAIIEIAWTLGGELAAGQEGRGKGQRRSSASGAELG